MIVNDEGVVAGRIELSRRFERLWIVLLLAVLSWQLAPAALAEDDPEFTETLLNDPETIARGKDLFVQECRHCHGKSSYPGKAPKLKPKKLSAEDVYLRMSYGWRKMPAWEEVLTQDERVAVTVYVKSKNFSP
jgi:mono/diheme cytochrome c family protein